MDNDELSIYRKLVYLIRHQEKPHFFLGFFCSCLSSFKSGRITGFRSAGEQSNNQINNRCFFKDPLFKEVNVIQTLI